LYYTTEFKSYEVAELKSLTLFNTVKSNLTEEYDGILIVPTTTLVSATFVTLSLLELYESLELL